MTLPQEHAVRTLLRHLLTNYRPVTIAVLCGIMIGALNKLWPFQDKNLVGSGEHQVPQYQNVLPASLGLQTITVILSVLVSALIVLWLDRRFTAEAIGAAERP